MEHSVLFDSGPEDYAFERNTTRLGADLGKIESIVLSHGHWDHSGAMLMALGAIRARNGSPPRRSTGSSPCRSCFSNKYAPGDWF